MIKTIQNTDIPSIPENYRVLTSSFVSLVQPYPNAQILLRELKDAGLSVIPLSVQSFPSEVIITCSSQPSVSDQTSINAICSAHKGNFFEPDRREWFYDEVVQAPINSQVDALVAQGNNFKAGNYDIEWYAEIRIDNENSGAYAKTVFHYKVDGPVEARSMSSNIHDDWVSFSGKYPMTLKDGSSVSAKLTIQSPPRTGQTPTTRNAEIRRCRIFINRVF